MKASLSKNDHYVFNKFVRNYKHSLQKFSSNQFISKNQLHNILQFLGYIDQYVSQQAQQLVHTISYLLSESKDCLVTKGNLFQFLRVISDIKKFPIQDFMRQTNPLVDDVKKQLSEPLVVIKIGFFDQTGQWKFDNEEQIQIKKIFGSMNLKRISRQNIEAQLKSKQNQKPEEQFKPEILDKSRQMAITKYKKISLDKTFKVQDRLLHNKSLQKSRLEAQVNKSFENQMRQCTFKPKINTSKNQLISHSLCKYIDSMNTSFQNKQNEKSFSNIVSHQGSLQSIQKMKSSLIGDKLLIKGKQYDQHIQKLRSEYRQINDFSQMKECYFQPKLCEKAHKRAIVSEKSITKIRNAQKSVQRIKQGRKKREFENSVKQRGYPKEVAWTKFMNEYKNDNDSKEKEAILCIDLKLMNKTKKVKVYEGQRIEQISKRICLQNEIPHEFWQKIETLIRQSIEGCSEVRIKQEKVYLKKQESKVLLNRQQSKTHLSQEQKKFNARRQQRKIYLRRESNKAYLGR